MKKFVWAGLAAFVIAASFFAGSWYTQRNVSGNTAAAGRKILYYVDPMHPSYKSDKPGIAPDCGMELVPVYEDGGMGGAASGTSAAPGTLNVGFEKQQLIGVRIAPVEKAAGSHALRLLGRVAADERRTYRVIAGIDGFIRDVSPVTTGDHVRKGEVLATFSAPLSISAIQAYILAAGGQERARQSAAAGTVEGQALPLANANIQQRTEQLQNMGMSLAQMEEIRHAYRVPESIRLAAPGDGVILTRNVSVDQRFDRGTELYRIADLRQVWILADVYENDARYLHPGTMVKVSLPQQQQTFHARVSKVRPQFDAATRTLKVRLEADNPGDLLRPDMFVDLEVPVTRPEALVVPVDAIVDSGSKKTVYVAKNDGVFEPRRVETGWRAGDQIEIVKGLMVGEQIVVSGTFLIDSESRMKAAAAGITGETSIDPICEMVIDQAKAKAAGRVSTFRGETYYFCSDDCKEKFAKEPTKYLGKAAKGAATEPGKRLEQVEWKAPQSAGSSHAGHAHETAASHAGHVHMEEHARR